MKTTITTADWDALSTAIERAARAFFLGNDVGLHHGEAGAYAECLRELAAHLTGCRKRLEGKVELRLECNSRLHGGAGLHITVDGAPEVEVFGIFFDAFSRVSLFGEGPGNVWKYAEGRLREAKRALGAIDVVD